MSDREGEPRRTTVRVRRSPRIGVFLALGAVVGALVAIVAVNVTPVESTVPTTQAIGFLILLLAPVGALLGGVVALIVDAGAERRAREVQAEHIAPAPRPEEPAEDPEEDPALDADRPADEPLRD